MNLPEEYADAKAHLVSLQDNYDDEGAIGGYTEQFVDYAIWVACVVGIGKLASISPCDRGSIDVWWDRLPHGSVLINLTRDDRDTYSWKIGNDRGAYGLLPSMRQKRLPQEFETMCQALLDLEKITSASLVSME